MAKGRVRGNGKLKRKPTKIKPKTKVFAFCEGEVTEPGYIMAFSRLVCNPLVDVEALGPSGVPVTVVQRAVEKREELDRTAKKSKDPLDKLFDVWAVFDCDEHPNIDRAFQLANNNNIKIAYSNPCFEIWPVLHYYNQSAHIDRHVLQRDLERIMESYDSGGSKYVDARCIFSQFDSAKERAIRLAEGHAEVGTPMANPYTDIYKLLDFIKTDGK